MKKPSIFSLVIFILVDFVLSQGVSLRLQPEQGQTFNYLLLSEATMTQSAMGMEQVVFSKTESKFKYLIQNVSPNGNVEMLISIDTIKTSIKAQMPPMDTTLSFPIAFKFKQVHDKYWKLLNYEIIEGGEIQIPMGGGTRRIDKRNYTFSLVFPQDELTPGKSWSFSYSDTSSAEEGKTIVKTSGKYTFEGVEEKLGLKCARLKLDANLSLSGSGTIQGMNYGLEGEGKNKGTVWVEVKSGMIVYSEMDTEMDMAMGISGQVEMTMPMTQKVKSTLSLIK
jgi:hypothetical protein